MSLLSEYLEKHPPLPIQPNYLIKGMTEQSIIEMSAAIADECRKKGVKYVDIELSCYIDGKCHFVDMKRIDLSHELNL